MFRKRHRSESGTKWNLTVGLCAVVVLVLVVFGGLALAAESETSPSDSSNALPATSDPTVVAEAVDQRTATSRTFKLSDGQLETRLYEVPINYRDSEGDWQPIEEGLRETSSGAIVNGANSFDVRLPEDLNEAPVKLSTAEAWVSQRPLDIAVADAEVQGSDATYPAAGERTAFDYSGLANGLKENIELLDASAPTAYRFELEASSGVEAQLTEEGAVEFRDSDGNEVAVIPAPVMSDAAGAVAPEGAVHFNLEADGEGRWILNVQADPQWLEAPGRAWPATIDPSWVFSPPALDCVITNATESTMCGPSGWSTLAAKAKYTKDLFGNPLNQYSRSLLRFTLKEAGFPGKPIIPASASFTSARIGLYAPKESENVSQVDLYDISRTWESGASWKYTTAQHTLYGTKWAKEGGDYGSAMPSPTSIATAARGAKPGWWEFSSEGLAWLMQRWNSGGVLGAGAVPNNGVLVKLAEEGTRICCIERKVEWESSAGTNKPYLAVNYMLPASAAHISSPTDGTKTAKRFLLTADWDEGGVEAVSFQYRRKPQVLSTPEEPWHNVPEGQVIDQEGNGVASWPYKGVESRKSKPLYWDASSLTEGKISAKLQVRAVVTHVGANANYTQPVEVEVNKDSGSPKDAVTGVGPGDVDLITGNFTVARIDVAIPGVTAGLNFSRSIQSRESLQSPFETNSGVLGPGWKPSSPVEEANSGWRSVTIEAGTETVEEEEVNFRRAELVNMAGEPFPFEEGPEGKFSTPDELAGYVLYRLSASEIALTDTSGNRTIFKNTESSPNEYLPVSVSMKGGNESRLVYKIEGGVRRLEQVIAPPAPGVNCSEVPTLTQGCRVLWLAYQNASFWGAPESAGMRLQKITYYAAGNSQSYGGWEVAKYEYNTEGRLIAEWDPRISPALKETYGYTAGGQLATLTPPGLQPWTMEYGTIPGDSGAGRLIAVKRPSLVESSPTAQTTIAYAVPLSKGAGGPYAMQPKDVAAWDQKDAPTDGTAVFPPNEVPSSPPSAYTRAAIYYMDAEGQVVNEATPAGAGTEAPSITTTEADSSGNVVRELSAQNRLRALEAGGESVAKSRKLDSEFTYDSDGYELLEELGPEHQVRLESGGTTQARSFRTIQYDEGVEGIGAGEPMPGLPTTETTGAQTSAEGLLDRRTTEYRYYWNLLMLKETIADPGEVEKGFLNLRSVRVYNSSGQVVESRQPSNPGGGGAGTRKTVYYKAGSQPANCESSKWAGLPCRVEPAAAPTPNTGQPLPLVTKFLAYNQLGEPTETSESPGGGSEGVRKTVITYDAAGRQTSSEITGGGTAVPKTETLYSETTGAPTVQRFCGGGSCPLDRQETTTTYDSLGRVKEYEDADGNKATTTYDLLGRPVTLSDAKGSQTMTYDSVTGLPVKLEDSAAGTITASYDADGMLVKETLPNGLTQNNAFDETGAPVRRTYTKTSSCGPSCTWLSFSLERSINGQILSEESTQKTDFYSYDKVGRLVGAQETPAGGNCTTRSYKYDADSNRERLITVVGALGGACGTGSETKREYKYDTADRLIDEGISYDSWGRTTKLPASDAGGNELTTSYYSTDMVASQTQKGITNTYELDASLRQRSRLQGGGGLEGVEAFHYDGPGDSPAWTERGATWTRSITGIGGELVAIQESGTGVSFNLTSLHGDVVATADPSPTATKLKATQSYDEFGNQTGGASGARYGWLGGLQRRTELPSGIVQMGARSYAPAIGRFLSGDSITGGSANAYDYGNADPVNQADPTGTKPYDTDEIGGGACKGDLHVYSYGNHFHARYKINCNARGYTFHVLKIQKYFMKHTTNGLSLPGHSFSVVDKSEHKPHNPGAPRFQGEWGNWYSDHGEVFRCNIDIEYQYLMFVIIRWTFNGMPLCSIEAKGRDDCIGEEGGGTLELKAQEICGHGSY